MSLVGLLECLYFFLFWFFFHSLLLLDVSGIADATISHTIGSNHPRKTKPILIVVLPTFRCSCNFVSYLAKHWNYWFAVRATSEAGLPVKWEAIKRKQTCIRNLDTQALSLFVVENPPKQFCFLFAHKDPQPKEETIVHVYVVSWLWGHVNIR